MVGCPRGAGKSGAAKRKTEGGSGSTPDSEPLGYEQELLKKDKELRQITEHKARRQQVGSQISEQRRLTLAGVNMLCLGMQLL